MTESRSQTTAIDLRRLATQLVPFLTKDRAEEYFQGEFGYEWRSGRFAKEKAGAYEEKLASFLLRDPGHVGSVGQNLMVIVGGIGTGKTTAVSRVIEDTLSHQRKCSKSRTGSVCNKRPRLLSLDFRGISPSDVEHLPPDAEKNRFWNLIATRVFTEIGEAITPREEVTEFWHWCLSQQRVLEQSPRISQLLTSQATRIRAAVAGEKAMGLSAEENVDFLLRERESFLGRCDHEDVAWYRIFLLPYLATKKDAPCACTYIFLDNVDQLDPDIQRRAVDAVIAAADLAGARTIVAIRPLTWEQSVHAHMLVDDTAHFGPSPASVIQSRVKEFCAAEQPDSETQRALWDLTNALTDERRYPLLYRMFRATCGLSVRAAQRNFANFMNSPRLSNVVLSSVSASAGRSETIAGLRPSEVARAFFFGPGESIDYRNFEQLYSVDGDKKVEHRLVKPRILDILCRKKNGVSTFAFLAGVLRNFGYSDQLLLAALNEMLRRSRPLIWSESGYICTVLDSPARVMATPIGREYYQELFGEYYYDEVCIARSQEDVVAPRDVYKFHQELTEQDLVEVNRFGIKRGNMYYELYSRALCSLSLLHCQRLFVGLQHRVLARDPWFDANRADWITERIFAAIPPPS